MSGNLTAFIFIGNGILAIVCAWLLEIRCPEYYRELSPSNDKTWLITGMPFHLAGHVLIFAYWRKTKGLSRLLLLVWSPLLWMLIAFPFFWFFEIPIPRSVD
jgi:hypothetical protein